MGSVPNLSVKRSVYFGTMLNFDGEGHGYSDGHGTCKQALGRVFCRVGVQGDSHGEGLCGDAAGNKERVPV